MDSPIHWSLAETAQAPSHTRRRFVGAGVSLMSVRDLLGHASIKMTERYAHLAPDNVRHAVRQLEGEDEKSHFGHTG